MLVLRCRLMQVSAATMNAARPIVNATLRAQYDGYYRGPDEWRRIGATDKVRNIEVLCRGHQFNDVIEIGAGEGSVTRSLQRGRLRPTCTALRFLRVASKRSRAAIFQAYEK
jgi:hypothetical protein